MTLRIRLSRLEGGRPAGSFRAGRRDGGMEFHVSREARELYGFEDALFGLSGNLVFADFRAARDFAQRMNARVNPLPHPERYVKAGQINAMGLIDEVLHYVVALYREQVAPGLFKEALAAMDAALGADRVQALLLTFAERFPPAELRSGKSGAAAYLAGSEGNESRRELVLEELLLLRLANLNPAFEPFGVLFAEKNLSAAACYAEACGVLRRFLASKPGFGPDGQDLWDLLRSPAVAEPNSLSGQLDYIRTHWGLLAGGYLMRLLGGLDLVREEEKPHFAGPGPTRAYVYEGMEQEYERFTEDRDWMPRVVLLAKTVLVWPHQLSKAYGRTIDRLDLIPDEELDELARRGFNGLWLIGLWERSRASREIKRRMGNPEAAASAYSLDDYDIAGELGGWAGLDNLRSRCARRGIRLGSDMVPNHTGLDSRWIVEHPDRFLQLREPPFPGYAFNGDNLCDRPGVGVYLEDHYWNRSDAAVVFKRVDFNSGDVRYIYHGNDGTSMPWNDTAQIDFLNAEAREAVVRTIVGVCRQFPIVRFDAAMTLAKRHIQRLWYPEPGKGGDIASRSAHGLSAEDFDRLIPKEFWREVVDRCASEAPDTLLLAEAFWMMEGYFVRTLGMHRVYNSAFMNMLKAEENAKYRATIKNTIEFDPEILKRFVNFMNNPDEETAVAQFGKADKYFGVCTLMATMPGLPMFGHGQVEGLEEKYGMEYRRAYKDEAPDAELVARHDREIFPLLKRRRLFSGSEHFALYDVHGLGGAVQENLFAYSNRSGGERALVLYNNAWERASGWLRHSAPAARKAGDGRTPSLGIIDALGLSRGADRWVLMRDQRTDLWYLRSAKDLDENGLFVSLEGYRCQVFLDIHEISDDATGRWARLAAALDGRGVKDLQAALQDLFLKDLYAAFADLASDDFLRGARDGGFAAEELRAPLLRFRRVAEEYLDGASGAYEAFPVPPEARSGCDEAAWKDFAQAALRLRRLAAEAAEIPAGLDAAAAAFLKKRSGLFGADRNEGSWIAGYLCLAALRGVLGEGADGGDAARLAEHWSLDRKLAERLVELGEDEADARRRARLLKQLLARRSLVARPCPEAAAKSAADACPDLPAAKSAAAGKKKSAGAKTEDLAAVLAENFFESEAGRDFLHVNVFEGVRWFNKERSEEALLYASLVEAVDEENAPAAAPGAGKKAVPAAKAAPLPALDGAAWRERLGRKAEAFARLEAALAASGYRVDAFLAALAPKTGNKTK